MATTRKKSTQPKSRSSNAPSRTKAVRATTIALKALSPAAQPPKRSRGGHRLDARPDTLDFRDRMYEAALVEVSPRRPLELFCKVGVPVLDQGTEGACTGFGLATVVNFLLRMPAILDQTRVSPRMLYEMAKRYDEWPGEKYEGSSARGAMKGWRANWRAICSRMGILDCVDDSIGDISEVIFHRLKTIACVHFITA